MVKIAVCEDNLLYIQKLKELTSETLNVEFFCFESGELLINSIERQGFTADIYIMDIELPGINGLEVARKIRQLDKYAVIIFMTNYEHYVFDAFEVNTFRYIIKDKMDDMLVNALEAAFEQVISQEKYKYISIKNRDNGILRIELDEIISIEKVGKFTEFRLKNGTLVRDTRTLKNLIDIIKSECFVIAQKGVIVNVRNIVNFNGNKLTMADNSVQYVSRNNMKKVKLVIVKCWR
jgi:DNA-binding LytR/AlgR family response regulator